MRVLLLFFKLLHRFIRLTLQECLFVGFDSLGPPFIDGLLREHQIGKFLSVLCDLLCELIMLSCPFGLDVSIFHIDKLRPDWYVIDIWL